MDQGNEEKEKAEWAIYPKGERIALYALFFFMGIINHLGTILVMTGGRVLAIELKVGEMVQLYTSMSTVFAIVTRMLNSRVCIKVSYKKRLILICFWMIIGYVSMFGVLQLHESIADTTANNYICFALSFIPCFFLGSAYAFGEGAIIAYLRLFPKTLISGWSSGTGLSGIVSATLNLVSQAAKQLKLKFLYLALAPLGPIYLALFLASFKIYDGHKRDERTETNNEINQKMGGPDKTPIIERNEGSVDAENESEKVEENTTEESKELTTKLDDLNKKNMPMNCKNFKTVMSMVGRVIINLGVIYFVQFFIQNTVMLQCCNRIDVPFMPANCEKDSQGKITSKTRKGKFEFLNMFFQLGMFTSKTFIKLVRKIQPIEVYTIAMCVIMVFYFIEYFTGFCGYGVFIPVNLILGFFAGGTYAGGFYTILNSDKVDIDYKELTVNVATLFNDTGTFLSGILGYVFYNHVIKKNTPFDKYQVPDSDCK